MIIITAPDATEAHAPQGQFCASPVWEVGSGDVLVRASSAERLYISISQSRHQVVHEDDSALSRVAAGDYQQAYERLRSALVEHFVDDSLVVTADEESDGIVVWIATKASARESFERIDRFDERFMLEFTLSERLPVIVTAVPG